MAEIGKWKSHVFEVSPKLMRSFEDLTIKGASDTEDEEKSKQVYVKRKNGKPLEIGMTVLLSGLTGCSVQKEALSFVAEARSGASDYLYIGGKKLVMCKLMLTEASVSDAVLSPSGQWVSCKVKLKLKQAGLNGTETETKTTNQKKTSGGGGSTEGSENKTSGSTKKKTVTTVYNSDIANNVRNKAATVARIVKNAKAASGSVTKSLGTKANSVSASSTPKTSVGKVISSAKKVAAKLWR